MKTHSDPRHLKRIKRMQALFAWDFQKKPSSDIKEIVDNLSQIDQAISASASERPIEQINKIDLSLLRLAVFELIIEKKAPIKVVIDEAVELAKEYGSDSSPAFVNGALGKLVEQNKLTSELAN